MLYDKPWLSLTDQIDRLESHGVDVGDRAQAEKLLCEVGYYRLTGYLYPFRAADHAGYRPGTRVRDAAALIDFDRRLRLLVLEAIERVEISLRMRMGYVIGEVSAFAHRDEANFMPEFTKRPDHATSNAVVALLPPDASASKHDLWWGKAAERQSRSSENFVLLAHLSEQTMPKDFGVFSALAVLQYLLRSVDPRSSCGRDLAGLLGAFPSAGSVTLRSMGVPDGWEDLPLWRDTVATTDQRSAV